MLGHRLKYLRMERNKSQEELGKLLGISKATIAAYETDARQPSLDILVKQADFFGVTTDYLTGRNELPTQFKQVLVVEYLEGEYYRLTASIIENVLQTIKAALISEDIEHLRVMNRIHASARRLNHPKHPRGRILSDGEKKEVLLLDI